MTDLDCHEFVELAGPYDAGELDDLTADRLREHRSLCDGCDRYGRQLEQTVRLVRRVASPPWGLRAIR